MERNKNDLDDNLIPQHQTTCETILSTAIACLAAACITYPAETSRLRWEKKVLRFWDPEQQLYGANIQRKQFRVITPIFRLVSFEVAGTILSSVLMPGEMRNNRGCWQYEVISGAIAGTSQALILTPIEAWRANKIMHEERRLSQQWIYGLKSQLLRGGVGDPEERRLRAFRGIRVAVAREVAFNVTFFPLFHGIKHSLCENGEAGNKGFLRLTFCSVLSATISSLVVTPMDILRSYLLHSRERWSIWSGKRLHAVPIELLTQRFCLQALYFGPAFGVVAAIYEVA